MSTKILKEFKLSKFRLVFLGCLFLGLTLLLNPINVTAQESDAIAVRIIENPNHYSSARWYQLQNFQGSPQSLQVDGYEAIRNGRTVYVNAANVVDTNNDGTPDAFYTNIFIISYTQNPQTATSDIFGQLLKNFKFNTNFFDLGACSATNTKSCLSNKDCPKDEYCNSQKSRIVRDVKRLGDLAEMQTQLEIYKQKNGTYPKASAGTYVSGKSISTWPSWQENFAKELGINLPIDPINKLGACPGYDETTCWNAANKTFATDLFQSILPPRSYVYVYLGDARGASARFCAQMESNYQNLQAFNCSDYKRPNNQPVIKDVSLYGWPKKEFNGYVSVFDADGDPLKLTIDLVSPAPNVWLLEKWGGIAAATITALPSKGQMKIYVPVTGNAKPPGYYKVRLNLNDGQGAANSIFSQVYDLTVNSLASSLTKSAKTITIGQSDLSTITGTDSNGDPINKIFFEKATFNGVAISETVLNNAGFSISGSSVSESFKAAQRTGTYIINVYALDSIAESGKIYSTISYTVINNPPTFKQLTATFSNNTKKVCAAGESCYISIDNAEAATIKIEGEDKDGHNLVYSLTDNPGNLLSINSSTGVISGLEKLNFHELEDEIYNISVKISDSYCPNSNPSECSVNYSFSLKVLKYCSVSLPASTLYREMPGIATVSNSGDNLNTGIFLEDCSEVGTSSVDVKFVGEAHSQAIVLVSDLSSSMEANVVVDGVARSAISRLKSALTTSNTGFLDSIYGIASNWPPAYSIKIGLIGYNSSVVSKQSPINLVAPGSLGTLKNSINNYSTNFETNTLKALNEAELLLDTVTDPGVEKIVILMSDGIPGIDGYAIKNPYCYTPSPPSCSCGGTYPDCDAWPSCTLDEWISWSSSGCTCIPRTCYCGGTYPNCDAEASCPSGQLQGGCTVDDCYTPAHSSFNPFQKLKYFFAKLLKPESAQAVTTQTQCIYKSCTDAFPSFTCSSNEMVSCSYYWELNCDLTPDVNNQADVIKGKGIALYTIYYNTSNTLEPKQKMCDWSSNNGVGCDDNVYTFAGSDINLMINRVLARIVTKPKDVIVGSSIITDNSLASTTSFVSGALIDSLTCGAIAPKVTFSNNGHLEFSNLKLNYCPAKLHP